MIVVDASALTNALADDGDLGRKARSELRRDSHWAAPDHCVAEVFSAVRGQWLGGQLTDARARDAVSALGSMVLDLVPARSLLVRMWQLRHNVSGYDAAYVALAEALDCALVTAEARLAQASTIRCPIRLALPA
ncbi:type II toxin-antitoxin system VapC family toxin [Ornithinimicrobium murale]|uniref:type II toxin-antitoxin system VapC family toxin n=1 Tax=Ornithinimicrobium murale TaxID=1050153 RepID=UPI000E0DDC2E|nr:type II toxin-antitoxin system VapC family toxin [Ornithinimicrobium murale]